MKKVFYPDFFNDVFGPIMQPGSSGGFAGPCRIGNVASRLVTGRVKKVVFSFNPSSAAKFASLGNFMSDRGYLGGVLGYKTDDIRLFDAHKLAREAKVSYEFKLDNHENGHANALTVEVTDDKGEYARLVGASVGGGMIMIYSVDDIPLDWQADTYLTLVSINDRDDSFEALKTYEAILGDELVDCRYIDYKDAVGKERMAIAVEHSKDADIEEVKKIFNAGKVYVLPAVLPVVTRSDKKEQLFTTVAEWRDYADSHGIDFYQAAIEYEKASSGWSTEEIVAYFEKIAAIFDEQIHSLERKDYDVADTPLLPVYGKKWKAYRKEKKPISDSLTQHILTHAYAVNAKVPGVIIVPGPMGTGGGYLYSALDAVREDRGFSHEKEIEGLVIAAALGALAYTHTNASGERGCIGESGVCCAMASGAITWMAGGDGKMVENAASMALQANMGLQCDPIPGGLEFPCITRTIRAAVSAVLYAEMALTGIDPLIPYHECLQAIEHNYVVMPHNLLCGNNCGCNCTPTAKKRQEYLTDLMADNLKYEA